MQTETTATKKRAAIQTVAMIGAGIILYSLFRKKAALGTLNFYPASVTNIQFEGATPVMTLGLAVQNTSNQIFMLRSLAGNVFSNGYLVGNVGTFAATEIPANSQSLIYIKVRMSLIGIVNDIVKAFTTGNIKQEIELDATANVDNLQLPINLKYTVG